MSEVHEIVSRCPHCRSPIYGPRHLPSATTGKGVTISVQCYFSCDCYSLIQERLQLQNDVLREQVKCMKTCREQQRFDGDEWKKGEHDD